ncbi:MAG TPA: hypothetical protein DF614_05775, partial [Methylococcaceae bacterium]|nr:hypothetical protein [Methylococcaceae bacterium]
MQRRLFLLLVSFFPYASPAAEKSSAWNCAQSSDGKEWVCQGDDNTTQSKQATSLPAPSPSDINAPQVAPVVAIPQRDERENARVAPIHTIPEGELA